ncbi:MAG: ComF family protein [Firmicutes bacterium]|nr:ComF family protein [Bacillota bacterium]
MGLKHFLTEVLPESDSFAAQGKGRWGLWSFTTLAAQFFFPQRYCLNCGSICLKPGLCVSCAAKAAALPRCKICASFVKTGGLCSNCEKTRPLFTQARSAVPYEGKLRDYLLEFKYLEKTWLRRPLAALLMQVYQQYYHSLPFSIITAVPLSSHKKKERGYNQSAMLTQLLAKEYGLNYQKNLLRRVLDTPPLASYNGEQRRLILKQAFVSQEAQGHTVLLIDDIYTSGATLNACSAELLAAGAKEVYGLTVAAYDDRGS